jgi:hypothetical protein
MEPLFYEDTHSLNQTHNDTLKEFESKRVDIKDTLILSPECFKIASGNRVAMYPITKFNNHAYLVGIMFVDYFTGQAYWYFNKKFKCRTALFNKENFSWISLVENVLKIDGDYTVVDFDLVHKLYQASYTTDLEFACCFLSRTNDPISIPKASQMMMKALIKFNKSDGTPIEFTTLEVGTPVPMLMPRIDSNNNYVEDEISIPSTYSMVKNKTTPPLIQFEFFKNVSLGTWMSILQNRLPNLLLQATQVASNLVKKLAVLAGTSFNFEYDILPLNQIQGAFYQYYAKLYTSSEFRAEVAPLDTSIVLEPLIQIPYRVRTLHKPMVNDNYSYMKEGQRCNVVCTRCKMHFQATKTKKEEPYCINPICPLSFIYKRAENTTLSFPSFLHNVDNTKAYYKNNKKKYLAQCDEAYIRLNHRKNTLGLYFKLSVSVHEAWKYYMAHYLYHAYVPKNKLKVKYYDNAADQEMAERKREDKKLTNLKKYAPTSYQQYKDYAWYNTDNKIIGMGEANYNFIKDRSRTNDIIRSKNFNQ